MSDIFWLIGMYGLFIITGAAFLGWLGAVIMLLFFPVLAIGIMMS